MPQEALVALPMPVGSVDFNAVHDAYAQAEKGKSTVEKIAVMLDSQAQNPVLPENQPVAEVDVAVAAPAVEAPKE